MNSGDKKKYQQKTGMIDVTDTKETIQSDESFNSDLNNIKDNCENFFNIDKHNTNETNVSNQQKYNKNMIRYGFQPYSYNPYLRISHPDLLIHKRPVSPVLNPRTQHVVYKKTALDYLSEIAEQENERINKKNYEKNSFSSDNIYVEQLKELRRRRRDRRRNLDRLESDLDYSNHELMYNTSPAVFNRKRREHRKKAPRKSIVLIDSLSNEEEAIESFADFPDSMFASKTKNNTRVFCCANKECEVELPSLSRIKRHYLVHTSLKPFKCLNQKCDKRFSRKDNMLQHFRTHCKNKKKKESY